MAKEKIRCARCHKMFKGSPRETLCPACAHKEHEARAAARATAATPAAQAKPAVAPRIMGAGASILDPRLAAMPSAVSPDLPAAPPARPTDGRHDRHDREPDHGHGHGAPAATHPAPTGGKPHAKEARAPRTPPAPRPRREPKPPTPPFELTDDLRTQIETRYLELSDPIEFDGIRTQIASELSVPKVAVKRAVRELRERMQLPSWWELQAYEGTPDDLERIRAAYTPLLPLPEVGVHLRIADDLKLESRAVYQGIRRIRAEMRLPQFNPPEAHGLPPATPRGASPANAASAPSEAIAAPAPDAGEG